MPSDVEKIAYGERPDLLFEMVAVDDRRRVGLFHVAPELREDLVERDADRDRDAELAFHAERYASFLHSSQSMVS